MRICYGARRLMLFLRESQPLEVCHRSPVHASFLSLASLSKSINPSSPASSRSLIVISNDFKNSSSSDWPGRFCVTMNCSIFCPFLYITLSEIETPLGQRMYLIDHDMIHRDLFFKKSAKEFFAIQPFRRKVQKLTMFPLNELEHIEIRPIVHPRKNGDRFLKPLIQIVDLIFYQRNKRGNDYSYAFEEYGRRLKADRFPSGRRNNGKSIVAFHYSLKILLLIQPHDHNNAKKLLLKYKTTFCSAQTYCRFYTPILETPLACS